MKYYEWRPCVDACSKDYLMVDSIVGHSRYHFDRMIKEFQTPPAEPLKVIVEYDEHRRLIDVPYDGVPMLPIISQKCKNVLAQELAKDEASFYLVEMVDKQGNKINIDIQYYMMITHNDLDVIDFEKTTRRDRGMCLSLDEVTFKSDFDGQRKLFRNTGCENQIFVREDVVKALLKACITGIVFEMADNCLKYIRYLGSEKVNVKTMLTPEESNIVFSEIQFKNAFLQYCKLLDGFNEGKFYTGLLKKMKYCDYERDIESVRGFLERSLINTPPGEKVDLIVARTSDLLYWPEDAPFDAAEGWDLEESMLGFDQLYYDQGSIAEDDQDWSEKMSQVGLAGDEEIFIFGATEIERTFEKQVKSKIKGVERSYYANDFTWFYNLLCLVNAWRRLDQNAIFKEDKVRYLAIADQVDRFLIGQVSRKDGLQPLKKYRN